MTRIALSLLVLLLTACAPATVDIGSVLSEPDAPCMVDNDGDGYYYPTTVDCHEDVPQDYDDNDPNVTEGPTGNADLVPSCFDGAVWLAILVDSNGDQHNDEVVERDIKFPDGSTMHTNYGMIWVPYLDQDIKFMTEGLSNEDLFVFTQVFVYNDTSVLLGELVPRMSAPWVAWDCPSC